MKRTVFATGISLLLAAVLAAGALATDVNQAISEGSVEEVYGEYEGEGVEEVDGVIAGENVMEGVEELPLLD